ncbi:hypothetical protein SAMN05892883_3623 [Jatrophihabitans sp. GAS493]|uniref:hypothetical protein n=1 Tax=Jatrophihabitans sp. GAS493 TaxID=1907575 RepID=UPI000BB9B928|nr:hypothetical protein [Jatrophihabitans sp. GAS493]SOD74438.1 hypothetical protein SAMN05892883_3623 [Jatrophihabitans sp. GAS493]
MTTLRGRPTRGRNWLLRILAAALCFALLGAEPVALAGPATPYFSGQESFESTPVGSVPAPWKFVEYTPGVSTAQVVSGADGTHYLEITSPKPNHARLVATVAVKPNSIYLWHAMIRARGVDAGHVGALLNLDNDTGGTEPVRADTWSSADLYIRTGNQAELGITFGLGNFYGVTKGVADFDSLRFSEVSAIPAGASTKKLSTAAVAPGAASHAAQNLAAERLPSSPPKPIYPLLILLVLAIGGAVVLLRRSGATGSAPPVESPPDTEKPDVA